MKPQEPPAALQKPESAKFEDDDILPSVEPALPEWEEGIPENLVICSCVGVHVVFSG